MLDSVSTILVSNDLKDLETSQDGFCSEECSTKFPYDFLFGKTQAVHLDFFEFLIQFLDVTINYRSC